MLPKAIADQLLRGEPVSAESFESVTIYFRLAKKIFGLYGNGFLLSFDYIVFFLLSSEFNNFLPPSL